VNIGYQWNGSSTLGGDPESGVAEDLPDVGVYAIGAVLAVHARVTFAADLVGRYVIDSARVRREEFQALDGRSVFPNITFESGSFNELSGAIGLKANLAGRLLSLRTSDSPQLGRPSRQGLAAHRCRVRVLRTGEQRRHEEHDEDRHKGHGGHEGRNPL
jgi:hypothetical protein